MITRQLFSASFHDLKRCRHRPGLPHATTEESFNLKHFNELGLAEPILRAVSAEGYTNPTPIQAGVIPAMIAGHDIVGIAQTGTGKTASFVLPILHKVHEIGRPPRPKSCRALILTPTRELSAQIADGIKAYGKNVRHHATVVVGGARPGPQVKAMARGLDILVATPGRLEDHMRSGAIRLDETSVVVLDEADQMLDLGFMPAIRRIMAALPKERLTALLSATMPKQIRALADDFLNNPMEISVAPASKPIERIEQSVRHMSKGEKRAALVDILKGKDVERAIIFTRTKHGANKVSQYIEDAGIPSGAIHGNKSQSQREKTLLAFRKGSVPVLVATDIAARGIDVDGVSHVVNFELPNIPEVYVHRIGRTARAGNTGIAISLCDETERGYLRDIEKLTGIVIPVEGEGPKGPDVAPEPRGQRSAGGRRNGQQQASKSRGGRRSEARKPREAGEADAQQARGQRREGGEARKPRNANAGEAREQNNRRNNGERRRSDERPRREASEGRRQERSDRNERGNRTDRNDRNDRNERHDRNERSARRSDGEGQQRDRRFEASGENGANPRRGNKKPRNRGGVVPPRKGEGDTSSAGLARMLQNIERSQSKRENA